MDCFILPTHFEIYLKVVINTWYIYIVEDEESLSLFSTLMSTVDTLLVQFYIILENKQKNLYLY